MTDDEAIAMLMKVCATIIIFIFASKQRKEALRSVNKPVLANLAIAEMCIHCVIIIAMWFR